MRTRAKRKNVVNDRARRENVPRHILCSVIGISLCQILSDFFCEDILNLTYYAPVSDYTVEERMRRMVRYTIYIDKLILVVWGFQLFQLIVMKKFFLCTATRRRILFVSVLGTLFFCIWFFGTKGNVVRRIGAGVTISNLLVIPICFHKVRPGRLWKVYLFSMSGLFVFGSCMMRLFQCDQKGTWIVTALNLLLLVWLVADRTYSYREKSGSWRQPVLPVIFAASGKEVSVWGFVDSGNHLAEPVSGKPVHVISGSLAKELQDILQPNAYVIVPFGSVGCEKSYLDGYRISEMKIQFDLETVVLKDQIVAIAKDVLKENCPYQMILHPSVLKRRTEHAVIGGRKTGRTMSAAWTK